nr:MAG TPA: Formyl peptide receptor-like 1 inhibitory protein [Bacteriophage sp.]
MIYIKTLSCGLSNLFTFYYTFDITHCRVTITNNV